MEKSKVLIETMGKYPYCENLNNIIDNNVDILKQVANSEIVSFYLHKITRYCDVKALKKLIELGFEVKEYDLLHALIYSNVATARYIIDNVKLDYSYGQYSIPKIMIEKGYFDLFASIYENIENELPDVVKNEMKQLYQNKINPITKIKFFNG